ncbi:MAG: Ppx/GppA family phosphatase [Acetobacteraceae bacterium]|nr:Ppx/GppA family phosphatase [Acetobacteraceae bacterium]MBV8524265.1 Ppx/GppA family phosphatase [Acetobacteraceae bacterium]MBV8589640.1 Ppx/GppA family phosphatase [Acetobacteraceae bacterium]
MPDTTLHPVMELDPARAARAGGPHYGVVDIGSNSVRLIVYDQLSRAPFPRFNEKSLCRLGAGLDQTGELSAESMRRTVEVMRRFRAVADAMEVPQVDAIATEAVRRATNGQELLARIAAESGFAVRILSGADEARYAALGVAAGFYRPAGLVGDMGGGSLEIAEILHHSVSNDSASMPLGALPVQAFLAGGKGSAKARVDAILHESLPHVPSRATFYAVGGGWRAFARVHMASAGAAVQAVHGYSVDAREARRFAKTLWRLPEANLAALPGVPARRIDTLPAAALVLDRVLKYLGPERLVFSSLGVREGWLYTQLSRDEQERDPLLEGAQSFGMSRARVPEFASALVRWTDDLFGNETPAERRLRVAACALSDIAWRDHQGIRAAESFRRLIQFPFIGLDHAERVYIASVVHSRYAGAPNDPALAGAKALLPAGSRRRALILGRVLLLGHRLSGSVPQMLESARLAIGSNTVRLEVGKQVRVPDSDVVKERLDLVARAAGAERTEIVEAA